MLLWREARAASIQVLDLAAQGIDVAFVGVLLHLGEFQRLKDLLHRIKDFSERCDATVHVFDRLRDHCRRGGTKISSLFARGGTLVALDFRGGHFAALLIQRRIRERRLGERRIAQRFTGRFGDICVFFDASVRVFRLDIGMFRRSGFIRRRAQRAADPASTATTPTAASAAAGFQFISLGFFR